MTAATAITISNRVARIGEIPFLDLNIFLKSGFHLYCQNLLPTMIFNKYEDKIMIQINGLFYVGIQ